MQGLVVIAAAGSAQVITLIVLVVAEELLRGGSSSRRGACPGRRRYLRHHRGGAQGPHRRHVRALWNLCTTTTTWAVCLRRRHRMGSGLSFCCEGVCVCP